MVRGSWNVNSEQLTVNPRAGGVNGASKALLIGFSPRSGICRLNGFTDLQTDDDFINVNKSMAWP
jgi:hypothetical protein